MFFFAITVRISDIICGEKIGETGHLNLEMVQFHDKFMVFRPQNLALRLGGGDYDHDDMHPPTPPHTHTLPPVA